MQKFFLALGMIILLVGGRASACDQITTWHDDDREFFLGYDGSSRETQNDPSTESIGYGHTSTPVTQYSSPPIHHDDGWVGTIKIYSYDGDNAAATDFQNEDIFYRGELSKCQWVSLTDTELIQGRCPFGSDDELYGAFGYVLYLNNIIEISFGPPTGEYVDVQTVYSRVTVVLDQARALIDSKCGGGTNAAPEISILPNPELESLDFQLNIVEGTGFTIFVEDPDGQSDLDLGTLQVKIAGVDKTAHFQTVLTRMWDHVEFQTTDNALALFIRPDPKLFMSDHNIFNIQWNGSWPVSLKICDKHQQCHTASYNIFFGPFFTTGTAQDLECDASNTPQEQQHLLRINGITIGNCGFEAPSASVYLAIQKSGGIFLTYQVGVLGVILSSEITTLLPPLPMPAGFLLKSTEAFDVTTCWLTENDEFGGCLDEGTYQLRSTVLDSSFGSMQIFTQDVPICD